MNHSASIGCKSHLVRILVTILQHLMIYLKTILLLCMTKSFEWAYLWDKQKYLRHLILNLNCYAATSSFCTLYLLLSVLFLLYWFHYSHSFQLMHSPTNCSNDSNSKVSSLLPVVSSARLTSKDCHRDWSKWFACPGQIWHSKMLYEFILVLEISAYKLNWTLLKSLLLSCFGTLLLYS